MLVCDTINVVRMIRILGYHEYENGAMGCLSDARCQESRKNKGCPPQKIAFDVGSENRGDGPGGINSKE